jgi:hypothetical protein
VLTNAAATENGALQGGGIFALAVNSVSVVETHRQQRRLAGRRRPGRERRNRTITDTTIDGNIMGGIEAGSSPVSSNTLTMSGTTIFQQPCRSAGGVGGGAYVAVANPTRSPTRRSPATSPTVWAVRHVGVPTTRNLTTPTTRARWEARS